MSRSKVPPAKAPGAVPDAALWEQATRDVKPLRKRVPRPAAPKPTLAAKDPPPDLPTHRPRRAVVAKPAPRPAAPAAPLAAGTIAGLDRRNAERLRRGQLPIEAVLDLHGMTQERAHRALDRFLAGAAASGIRCVLVITGKGRSKEEGGVLKREVPRWLNEPGLRPLVLAIATARPNHGGEGALYLLLKRRREV